MWTTTGNRLSRLIRGKRKGTIFVTWHDASLSRQNSIGNLVSPSLKAAVARSNPSLVSSYPPTMSPTDDYDKLTPEQREARDKADRAREAAEQAGEAL